MAYPLKLPQPLIERQEALEEALRAHVKDAVASDLPLYRMMEYQLGWIERDCESAVRPPAARFHGALCLEAAASVASGSGRPLRSTRESVGAAAPPTREPCFASAISRYCASVTSTRSWNVSSMYWPS